MDAFIGEIRAFPYGFAPLGWQECIGQALPVSQYQPLFAVIGYQFGGSGAQFKLPDLRGIAVMGAGTDAQGNAYPFGTPVGSPTVTLFQSQMPSHDHTLQTQGGSTRVTAPSSAALPAAPQYIRSGQIFNYLGYTPTTATPAPTVVAMSPAGVGVAGSGQAHENHSPYLVLRYCINVDAYDSVFPVRP
ncbi:phage tail protein [Azospirillum halopraeferens]|uniref:phage tail protein n=1 Tax=Azospirillum halopraeferens TaxID=34010 RepID=UPI0003F5B02E|nr:tail fiber protein [Azospirillum halopraeferens]